MTKENPPLCAYIAASFKHKHAVRLLGREVRALGFRLLDWTEKACPPTGLLPHERRIWMDTDLAEGQVFAFCRDSCAAADLVLYLGTSGQDAGIEIGIAHALGTPIVGIAGPLEAPGLMLHGTVDVWFDAIEDALSLCAELAALAKDTPLSGDRTAKESVAEQLYQKMLHKRAGRKLGNT